MPTIEVSHCLRLFYLDQNPAGHPAVLLLHGLGANSSSWQMQFPPLQAGGYRVLALDAPGFGRSTYPGGGAKVARTASQVAHWMDCLHVRRVHAVGISMGGTLALQLALDYPERVDKLVLANTFARLRLANFKVLPYFLLRFLLVHTVGLPKQAQAVAKRLFPKPEQEGLRQELIQEIVQCNPHGYRAAMRGLAFFDVQNRLGEIHHPTLVISGDRDTTVPMENQVRLAGGISGARHVIIPDAGHAVIVEQPEKFNQTLIQFLSEG